MAVDAHVSTCGPKVSTCNPRAQTRCVSKHITHTQCTLNTLTDTQISVCNAYYANSLSHTHAQMHIAHTHRYTQKCTCKLSVTHTHTIAHTHRNQQAKSLFNTQTYTQTQKVRRTDCIATIRHNTAQLVGGEE